MCFYGLVNNPAPTESLKVYRAVGRNTDNSQTIRVPHGSRSHEHDRNLELCVNDPVYWKSFCRSHFIDHQLSSYHPRTVETSGILTTTGRILFYNSWKENFGKLQIHCSEFHEWLIHLNRKHGFSYCPYSLVPDPSNFSNLLKMWGLRPWVHKQQRVLDLRIVHYRSTSTTIHRVCYHLWLLLLVRLGGYTANLSDFYSYRLIGKLIVFDTPSGVQLPPTNRGLFHYRRAAFDSILKSRVGNILTKAAASRMNLNLDGVSVPSHSQTSRLLTSSLSLGVSVPRPT
jgi:hypothetical protein